MQKKNGGYVLVMLLVVVAIGMMIYYLDIGMLGGPGPKGKAEKPEDQPWANENRLKNADPNSEIKTEGETSQASKKASRSHSKKVSNIKFTVPTVLTATVTSDKNQRGKIVLTIDPNGNCEGTWQTAYSYTHSAYKTRAAFKGNTDPERYYIENDYSKLWILARGNYTQNATNLETGSETQSKGVIYINGWINPDNTAFGTLSLTDDKKWHVDYKWTGSVEPKQ